MYCWMGHQFQGSRGLGPPGLVFGVDLLDEDRQFTCGRPYGSDRHLVVHALRTEQADGAEAPVVEPVGGADQRGVPEPGMRELDTEADERAFPAERLAEQGEQGC